MTYLGIGVAVYRKEDYQEILRLSEDSERMDQSWEEWSQSKKKWERNAIKMGIKGIDIIVLPRELVDFCRSRGLRITGESRAQFTSYKFKKLSTKK